MKSEEEVQGSARPIQVATGGDTPASLFTVPGSRSFDVGVLRAAEFPWTSDTVYLNNASIGPLPERTRLTLLIWTLLIWWACLDSVAPHGRRLGR